MMNQPEKRFRAGACTASVFVNSVQTPEGEKTIRNVVLQRTFKDKEGKWQGNASFSVADIPKAMLVMQKAYEYLALSDASPGDQNG